MIGRAGRQPLHPAAWWLWALLLAAAASRTTNPLLLGLLVVVAGAVVASCRTDAPWAASYGAFLRLAGVVLVVRTTFHLLLGIGTGTTVLVELPELELGDWAQGISIGGPISAEGMAFAVSDALRLGAMLACVGAANALASPRRLLRSLPAALYEVSVAVVVAMTLAPQLVERAGAVRRARALRGDDVRGVRALPRVLVPVLEGALDRSIALAASMDARGYGRHGAIAPALRRRTTALVVGGLLGLCLGSFGLLGGATSPGAAWGALGVGVLLAIGGLRAASVRVQRTAYQPDRWLAAEVAVVLSGSLALAGVVVAGSIDGASLVLPVAPLALPGLPPVAVLGALAGLLPIVVAPRPLDVAPAAAPPAPPAPRPVERPAERVAEVAA